MKNYLLPLIFVSLTAGASSPMDSICTAQDLRAPVKDMKIGRMRSSDTETACTVTMISKSCGITAGHCMAFMKVVEFDVPKSQAGTGKIVISKAENIYDIDQASIVGLNDVVGNDWAVLKLKPNKISGKLAGEVGGFYSITTDPVKKGEDVFIAGFGRDLRNDKTGNFTLQVDRGQIKDIVADAFSDANSNIPALVYDISTEGGDSGAVIIRERDKKIVGIHTTGGECSPGNMGTVINATRRMRTAIQNCLTQ